MLRYSELMKLTNFEDRLNYLSLEGKVGVETFGWERYFNQKFYNDKFWKGIRRDIIVRDNGLDLGVPDHDIEGKIIVHHMNPITMKDIENRTPILFDPEYLICVSFSTHQAIHYGWDVAMYIPVCYKREQNDTCPWKKGG